jgi:hypothetical protein
VTWSFVFESGSSPIKRWKGLMLDGYIGEVYEDGLETLKEKVEASRAQAAPQPAPVAPAPVAPAEEPAAEGGETVVPEQAPAAETPEETPAEQP